MKVKETFCSYTADFGNENSSKKMTDEMVELQNELEKTRNLVRLQRVRYQQLVSLFHVKLQEKEEETRADLQSKHAQLTCILRSLYILEAKLRKEQRALKVTLDERDALIRTQGREIVALRKQLDSITNGRCVCVAAAKSPSEDSRPEPNNKPDLISSIGIEVLKSDASLPSATPPDANTFVIASLDDYDASWSTLHVRGASLDASTHAADEQNAGDASTRNRMLDQELQNEMRKFKMKEQRPDGRTRRDEPFKTSSPRMILKEVTENPNEKLNGPVLNCVKLILSQHQRMPTATIDQQRCHPVKPPKPTFKPDAARHGRLRVETNNNNNNNKLPKMFLHDNTLAVKSLPKPERLPEEAAEVKPVPVARRLPAVPAMSVVRPPLPANNADKRKEEGVGDESKIVQTVSALLSDSAESEDEQTDDTSPTVSQMVKKFEGLKSKKKATDAKQTSAAVPIVSKTDSMIFQTNFEEFHLVDKEIDSTCEDVAKDNAIRLEAEGEENTAGSTVVELTGTATLSSCSGGSAKYETFLEVTGLSQKSILTPSRILSNHRNVMKPKDVKYRSRVKAAAGIADRCFNGAGTLTSPTMKYWTEPYL